MVPYNIHKPEFRRYFGTEDVNGIWVWMYRQKSLSHQGCILYQMTMKNTTQAVLLSVIYDDDMVLKADKGILVMRHSGHIGELEYHSDQDWAQAVVVTESIPPKNVELLQEYDLLKVWNTCEG